MSVQGDEALRRGAALYRAGRFFEAHDAWEAAWLPLRGTRAGERVRALIQLAAACVRLEAGSVSGFRSLARGAAERLEADSGEDEPAADRDWWRALAREVREFGLADEPDVGRRPALPDADSSEGAGPTGTRV